MWQSAPICLDLSWKTGLAEIYNATWLSHYINTGLSCGMCKSFNRCNNQVTSYVVVAIGLYSTSAEDLETTSYFFGL